ncbi:MAG: DNA mismatch repair protein MutS [bacterium]
MTADSTPMMKQYNAIKSQNPDAILMFRLGDFYEMFGEDARIASKVLDITLTSRQKGNGRIPMCGIPYHAAKPYIARLVKEGYRVAVCEQVEDPSAAKGIVKRDVVRIVTSGTIDDEELLDHKSNNFLVALVPSAGPRDGQASGTRPKRLYGLAFADVTTGEFFLSEIKGDLIPDELIRLNPAECILPERCRTDTALLNSIRESVEHCTITFLDDWVFDFDTAYETLISHLKVNTLKGFGCDDQGLGVSAAGGILSYLQETQRTALSHIVAVRKYNTSEFMTLDSSTCRNLELIRTSRSGEKKGSLLWVLDETLTSMGGRMLQDWILKPLLNVQQIQHRLDAVEELYKNKFLRDDVREILSGIKDIERLVGKIGCGQCNAIHLRQLSNSIEDLPRLKGQLSSTATTKFLSDIADDIDPLDDVRRIVDEAIVEEPPAAVREGGIIRDGYSEELDKLRTAKRDGAAWIAEFEKKERERTGISSLKVKFNNVFGYYIEVTKPNLRLVPKDYERKQTMVNAERFTHKTLKEYESMILGAEERIKELEYDIFVRLRDKVAQSIPRLQRTARAIARLDVLASLAEVAVRNNYCKPEIHDGETITIKAGRHPVVERNILDFIPNDAHIGSKKEQLLIITGPNMAGKSTYIRQVALIVLMAQMGSFIPAESASIGVVDRIFTRVGASDDLARGESTFMVEMIEAANILNNATPRSLIILDEVGRGTSTYDGVSIAWSIAEYIHNAPTIRGAKTLFATHYHELTKLPDILQRAKNYNVAVKESGNKIVFLRKIVPGGSDRSYGIHVAEMAGLPKGVVNRAQEKLKELERAKFDKQQITMFPVDGEDNSNPIMEKLREIDLDNITPIEAIAKLQELQNMARDWETKCG